MPIEESALREFADLIRNARRARGWTQPTLAEESGVSIETIKRYENPGRMGDSTPDPDKVRRVFTTLGLDPREAPVALGFLTREEMGLPPEPPRILSPTIEEVIAILEDPNYPEDQKNEWVEYLRFRTGKSGPAGGRERSPRSRRTG